jgi:hypothetical protein
MKKLNIVASLIFMLVLPFPARAADKAGDVVYLKGSALVERQAKKIKAALKSPLEEKDNVVTRDLSRLKILFRDDSILTLGSNSRLVIRQYLFSPGTKRAESIYELADGKLKAVVGGAGFKVTTPTAFAAARGTVFAVWYDSAANTTGIAVAEGEVEFRNINPDVPGVRIIGAGWMSSISGNEPPKPPQPVTRALETNGLLKAVLTELYAISITEPKKPEIPNLRRLVGDFRGQSARKPVAPPIDQQPANVTAVGLSLVFQ